MKTNSFDTGKYISTISKKASKIEAKAKSERIRRLFFLFIFLLVCLGGIIFGLLSRFQSIESQYQKYTETHDSRLLNNELLSYKDVFEQFEETFLGNRACQSLMGGFFYESSEYSIYPDETGTKMILHSAESEATICDGLASDINVVNGIVYFRKFNSRRISTYAIIDKETSELPLENVGQFIVCGGKIYYIDLSSSMLKAFDMKTAENEKIIQAGVSSFIVIGDNILFLSDDHILTEINLSNHMKTIIAKNISAFSYNGVLWMQNNEKVYTESLDKKEVQEVSLDIQCNRLLGVSGNYVYVESSDGVYICNVATKISHKVSDCFFVGASEEQMLLYDSSDILYKVIEIE